MRVVGINDFASRRGHRYGTIVVDEERREPIDLLPDREAATVLRWLEQHPEIEIIIRDRAVAYANAACAGAPQATQVADRFHLLQNLTEAVQEVVTRQHRDLRAVAPQVQAELQERRAAAPPATTALLHTPIPLVETSAAQRKKRATLGALVVFSALTHNECYLLE